jgi:hypothetical protein
MSWVTNGPFAPLTTTSAGSVSPTNTAVAVYRFTEVRRL